jgi:hypothetical protein
MQTIEQQFSEVTLIKCFEVEVLDTRTNETEYIIFDVDIVGNNFVATHVGLTVEQEESNKIAFVSIEIDEDFSLDANLQELHFACMDAVISSDFYQIIED